MVPQAALNAWAQHAPWQDELDIEQDLILSRSIIEIANHQLLGDALGLPLAQRAAKKCPGRSPVCGSILTAATSGAGCDANRADRER